MAEGLILPSRFTEAEELKQRIRSLVRGLTSDPMMHAETVAMGQERFRVLFVRDVAAFFQGNRIHADDLANHTYNFLKAMWTRREQRETGGLDPKTWLDKVEVVPEPTDAEIEDAWELTIGSNESALHRFYEGSARTRKGRDLGVRTNPLPPEDK